VFLKSRREISHHVLMIAASSGAASTQHWSKLRLNSDRDRGFQRAARSACTCTHVYSPRAPHSAVLYLSLPSARSSRRVLVESVSILSVCARCPKAHKAKGTSPAQCDAQLSSSRLNDRAEGLWLLGLGVGCFPSREARVEALRLNPIGQEIRRVAALQVDRLHEAVDDGRSV
jgi:hypothetical protein